MTYSIDQARQDLGRRLRDIRRAAGLTGVRLAELLSWSQPKVSKIETGKQTPGPAEIEAWTRACGRPDESVRLLRRLDELESMWVAWKDQLQEGHGGIQARLADSEEHIRVFRVYEALIVPGLLQTPGYARAVFEAANRKNETGSDVGDAVEQRIRRQEILYRRDKHFHFVLAESALWHRRGASDTMAAQMDRLITVSELPNVSLGIIPFDSAPPYLPLHGFWIKGEGSVVVETISARLSLTHESEIRQYLRIHEMAGAGARFGDGARALISRAAKRGEG